ncbi:MAG: MarR family transcriptional regulator [Spirochaetales bacterium]|nr:MarR family transcriptional regulator [Spirochaetales bacterium]
MKTSTSVGKWVSILYRFSQSYLKKKLKAFNLGPGQLQILLLLFHKEHVRQTDLALRLQLDKTSMARTISRLESKGYVRRGKDDRDARAYTVSLTQQAKNIRNKVVPILKNWNKTLLRGFSPEEQDQFIDFLIKAAKNAKKALKGEADDAFGCSD